VALGYQSGSQYQGANSVALGYQSGNIYQDVSSIAIGYQAGCNTQGRGAIAIGYQAGAGLAGVTGQNPGAIAIGFQAGMTNQGTNSIIIGYNAAVTNLKQGCIVINASGTTQIGRTQGSAVAASSYITPIRGGGTDPSSNNTVRVLLYDSVSSELIYNNSSTIKSFVIDHPLDKNKYLVHACLEGPESGVYYRGKGEIVNNEYVEIFLPDYTSAFDDFTVQVTPVYNGKKAVYTLQISEIENGKFRVYGENTKFHWLVQGKRGSIDVEPTKTSVDVSGNGPYKWISSKL
jgi:hypothetical protein